MRNTEIKTFLLAKSAINNTGIKEWLKFVGASDAAYLYLTHVQKTDAEVITEAAGRRCYMSFEVGLNPNVTRIRENICDYIDNILKVHHGSVLEHTYFTFAIENVSRVFTGEMNRHRAGMAISEGSMRYIRFEDMPWWLPTSLQLAKEEKELVTQRLEKDSEGITKEWLDTLSDEFKAQESIAFKKYRSVQLFKKAFTQMQENYEEYCDIWKEELSPESTFRDKKNITSCGRRIIGMGVSTGGVWTGNIRALRHIFEIRCTEEAEEEIFLVGSMLLQTMIQSEPNLFGDFVQNDKGYWKPKYSKV